jgi:hypothetical protein
MVYEDCARPRLTTPVVVVAPSSVELQARVGTREWLRPCGFLREVAFAEGWAVADRLRAKELLDELWVAGVQELRQRAPGGLQAYAPGFPVMHTEARLVGKPTLQGLDELVGRLRAP